MADLSRGVVGVIGRSLVVNVPGSPKAALESRAALEPTLAHALETLAGPYDHGTASGEHRTADRPLASAGSAGAATVSAGATPAASSTASDRADSAGFETPGDWVPLVDENDEWRDLAERRRD
jgi:hypothetical protein